MSKNEKVQQNNMYTYVCIHIRTTHIYIYMIHLHQCKYIYIYTYISPIQLPLRGQGEHFVGINLKDIPPPLHNE